jgi:hypothetical protein
MQTTDFISAAADSTPRAAALDFKPLIRALIELNIARKNVLFYPGSHIQVDKSIDLAHRCLHLLLTKVEAIQLFVAKDCLSVRGCRLDPANAVLQELRTALKSKNIAVLTLRQGLSKEEVADFLQQITRDDEAGGLGTAEADKSFQAQGSDHIWIQAVDYSKFRATEEEAIRRSMADGIAKPTASIWDAFVHRLAAGRLSETEDAEAGGAGRRPSPVDVACRLNRVESVEAEILNNYEEVIKHHLQGAADRCDQGDCGWSDLNRFLDHLDPRLRRQFLSVTLEQCASQPDPALVDAFLTTLPVKMIIDMLRAADAGEKEISPSLLNLIGKVLNARVIDAHGPERREALRLAHELSTLASPEIAGILFKKEDFAAYVTPDYEGTLKQLVRPQAPRTSTDEDRFDVQGHLQTLDDDHLSGRIAQVAIALLRGRLDPDLYREYADQLVRLAHSLAHRADIALLADMQELFLNHSRTEPSDPRRPVALAALEQLSNPRLIRALRTSLEASERWTDSATASFFFSLGPNVVPEALHLYLRQTQAARKEWLAALIRGYPRQLLKEVVKRLPLNPSADLPELLGILEELRDPVCIPWVHPYLQHPDQDHWRPALQVLLAFDDEQGLQCLKKLLGSKKHQEFMIGLELAETYGVTGVAADVAQRLKTRFLLFRRDFVRNEKILLALDRFGYRATAVDLQRLNRIRFSFFPKQLARMKSVVSQLLSTRARVPAPDRTGHPGLRCNTIAAP